MKLDPLILVGEAAPINLELIQLEELCGLRMVGGWEVFSRRAHNAIHDVPWLVPELRFRTPAPVVERVLMWIDDDFYVFQLGSNRKMPILVARCATSPSPVVSQRRQRRFRKFRGGPRMMTLRVFKKHFLYGTDEKTSGDLFEIGATRDLILVWNANLSGIKLQRDAARTAST